MGIKLILLTTIAVLVIRSALSESPPPLPCPTLDEYDITNLTL